MSTRFLTILFLSVLVAAAAVAVWYSFGMPGFGASPPNESEYRNTRFDYSFTYPRTLSLNEYSVRYVTLSTQKGEILHDVLTTAVMRTGEGTTPVSFDAFVRSQLPPLCAADIADAELECPTVREAIPFTTASGIEATAYTLDLIVRATDGGESETKVFGPVYAYDLTGNDPGSGMTVLFVYAPAIRVTEDTADQALVESVARSLTLLGVPAATTTPAAE
ncbi:MAG TPA: hypothetical protein VFY28_01030 [Candidatus Paceibacterota bacterium]|nr:hypothetical protein [Candidatus Paceibacterota bacterium]